MADLSTDHVERVAAEELPNLAEVPLAELLGSRDTALAQAIVRVLETTEHHASYAAFGNAP